MTKHSVRLNVLCQAFVLDGDYVETLDLPNAQWLEGAPMRIAELVRLVPFHETSHSLANDFVALGLGGQHEGLVFLLWNILQLSCKATSESRIYFAMD